MRVKEEHQEIYFFLQAAEEKLVLLEQQARALEKEGKDVSYPDREGPKIAYNLNYLLTEIREFGPYNDIEALLGTSFQEIKDHINKSLERLEKAISELQK